MPMCFQHIREGEPMTMPDTGRYGFSFLYTIATAEGGDLFRDGEHTVQEDTTVNDDREGISWEFKAGDVLRAWRS